MGGYGLGIDLGTTFTAAAVAVDGRAEMVNLGDGRFTIPSVVFLTESGELVVGDSAERRGSADPSRVAREFKRRLGDAAPLLVGGTPMSAEHLTAALLDHVLDTVTERRGGAPGHVVLTHPANWGDFKLEALRQAVGLSSARRVDLVSEPAAAAIAYAADGRLTVGDTVLVYDLGGGTFDLVVGRMTEGGLDLLAEPGGIERLGGIDLDAALLRTVDDAAGGALLTDDPDDSAAALAAAEARRQVVEAKHELSASAQAVVNLALPDGLRSIRVDRAEFERLIRPTLAPSVRAAARVLEAAGLAVDELDKILLVGGSSRVPLIGQLLGEELGRPVVVDADPKNPVALGAALRAGSAPQVDDEVTDDPGVDDPKPKVRRGWRRRTRRNASADAADAAVGATGAVVGAAGPDEEGDIDAGEEARAGDAEVPRPDSGRTTHAAADAELRSVADTPADRRSDAPARPARRDFAAADPEEPVEPPAPPDSGIGRDPTGHSSRAAEDVEDVAIDRKRPRPPRRRKVLLAVGGVLALLAAVVAARLLFADDGISVPTAAGDVSVPEPCDVMESADLQPLLGGAAEAVLDGETICTMTSASGEMTLEYVHPSDVTFDSGGDAVAGFADGVAAVLLTGASKGEVPDLGSIEVETQRGVRVRSRLRMPVDDAETTGAALRFLDHAIAEIDGRDPAPNDITLSYEPGVPQNFQIIDGTAAPDLCAMAPAEAFAAPTGEPVDELTLDPGRRSCTVKHLGDTRYTVDRIDDPGATIDAVLADVERLADKIGKTRVEDIDGPWNRGIVHIDPEDTFGNDPPDMIISYVVEITDADGLEVDPGLDHDLVRGADPEPNVEPLIEALVEGLADFTPNNTCPRPRDGIGSDCPDS